MATESPHWLIMGKMMSPLFLGSFWSFLYLWVTRTSIKWTSSNFSQIRPLTTELAALRRLKNSHRLIMGKCCLHASSFIFDRIIIKVAGNQDRHKSSDEFDFGPDQTTYFGVTWPWMTKILYFRTWISLKPATESLNWFVMGKMMSPPFLGCLWSDPFYICR